MQVLTGIFMSWKTTLCSWSPDLELGIEAFVDIKSDGSGKAVVPEKYITEIVRRAPTENVEFSFDSESSR